MESPKMSWDVSIRIDTGGKWPATVEEVRNTTYNNSEIFLALGVHPEGKEELTCAEWVPLLKTAMAQSWLTEASLRLLEPANKWGGLNDARDLIQKLLDACEKHPKAKVVWS